MLAAAPSAAPELRALVVGCALGAPAGGLGHRRNSVSTRPDGRAVRRSPEGGVSALTAGRGAGQPVVAESQFSYEENL